jgi:hypothetical protein
MPELTPDVSILKIIGAGGTFKGFKTYYLIGVPR